MTKYYSIQTKEAWESALVKECLEGSREYAIDYFIEHYLWMMEQMKNRLPNYSGEYPVWLWTERPDLRYRGHLEKGEKGILLEINIDEEDVLLSDFSAWHCVLNKMMLPINEGEEDEECEVNISKSWERIFDLDMLVINKYVLENVSNVDQTQGVTGKVDIKNIKIIREFIAR